MGYVVKEIFLTVQGEGIQAGRRAVFCRFAGCNLWNGREADRSQAVCQFCDTDFVGSDGIGGGRFADAAALADYIVACWSAQGEGAESDGIPPAESPCGSGDRTGRTRYVVLTGGEPMLQLDAALITALHSQGFAIAIETNGTLAVPRAIDWICVSPKAGAKLEQRSGDELKLVYPQVGSNLEALVRLDFQHFLIQPLDSGDAAANQAHIAAALAVVMKDSRWRLSLQTHKILGVR